MNPHHIKTLQTPFGKLILASITMSALLEAKSSLVETEDEASRMALAAWDDLTKLTTTLREQLVAITKGDPCPCESCAAERAEALRQAENIFAGGDA